MSGTEVDPLSADDIVHSVESAADSGFVGYDPAGVDGHEDAGSGPRWVRGHRHRDLQRAAGNLRGALHHRLDGGQRAPVAGSLQSVSTAGSTAALKLAGWTDQPDTAVGLFTIALNTSSGIQDLAGNHPSFAATAPADGAGPVPVGFRHQHNSGGACAGLSNVGGRAEPCDELTSEWSEQLLRSSIPTTTQYRITDPVGAGDQTVTIPGFLSGTMIFSTAGYLTVDGSSATWASSLLVLNSSADALHGAHLGSVHRHRLRRAGGRAQRRHGHLRARGHDHRARREIPPAGASSRLRRCTDLGRKIS